MDTQSFLNKGVCQDCIFWQRFETNRGLGICPLLGAILFEHESGIEVSLVCSDGIGLPPPVSDVTHVRTRQYFGCIRFIHRENSRYANVVMERNVE